MKEGERGEVFQGQGQGSSGEGEKGKGKYRLVKV